MSLMTSCEIDDVTWGESEYLSCSSQLGLCPTHVLFICGGMKFIYICCAADLSSASPLSPSGYIMFDVEVCDHFGAGVYQQIISCCYGNG